MNDTLAQWHTQASHFDFQGHQIAYWTSGNVGAPTLLLVHGFPTSAWDWRPIWETLGRSYRLIAADMLGFGLSDKPRSGYSIHRQTDLQVALLNHLGVLDYNAIVHDYGVSVGQELLARQQHGAGAEGLGRMIFLNGGIFPDQHRPRPIQKLGVSPVGFLVGLMMNRARFGRSFNEVFGPDTKPTQSELDEYWQFIRHNDGHRITHKLLHYIADRRQHRTRWEAALTHAQDRIGLINGALDPVSGKHAYDKWRAVVPKARHHLINTAGHYPQVEAPDEVAKTALKWMAE